MQQVSTSTSSEKLAVERMPEARYAYYRRCQVFRRNGEQCKAPAEKGSHICYAHAAQRAMAFRRDLERQIVLAEAVAQMRKRGKPECEMADLFTDFDGIQITIAVTAQALIAGRIDCKTAGRLLVQLQTMSKLLRMIYRKGREDRKENRVSPQISADERRLDSQKHTTEARRRGEQPENLPLINADDTDLKNRQGQKTKVSPQRRGEQPSIGKNSSANECEETRIILASPRANADYELNLPARDDCAEAVAIEGATDCEGAKVLQFEATALIDRSCAHGPPEMKAA